MRRPIEVFGAVCVVIFMLAIAEPAGLHSIQLVIVLGCILFGVLHGLGVFKTSAGPLSLVAGVGVVWLFWEPLHQWSRSGGGQGLHPAIVPVSLGLFAMVAVQTFGRRFDVTPHLRGRGLSTLPIWRRMMAMSINAGLLLATVLTGLAVVDGLTGTRHLSDLLDAVGRVLWRDGPASIPTVRYLGVLLLLAWVWVVILDGAKAAVGLILRPIRRTMMAWGTGLGGSSRFLGYAEEWAMAWRPGSLILGRSVYDGRLLGRKDDRHAIVIAPNRSGKGRSFIISNLLTYPGSAFVIDPKGENAAITARIRRMKLGQTVHVLDPFQVLDRMSLSAAWWRDMWQGGQPYRMARYNPMADIDLAAHDVVEQIHNLAAALVTVHPGANPFWDNASRIILAGVIAHVLVCDEVGDGERHLGMVRDYIAGIDGRGLSTLCRPVPAGRPVLGNLAQAAAAQFEEASETAGSDILVTLRVHMQWLGSEAMRANLSASDISLRDLKHRNTSVYLVIPPEHIDTHSCYLRVMVTMGLREAGKGAKPRHSILYMLDEFAALGRLDVVATVASVSTGQGIMLCPVLQNVPQLKVYGEKWEVFLSNAGQQIVFAVNDRVTSDYFIDRLGKHLVWQKRGAWSPYKVAELRTGGELIRETSRASGQALVSFEGGEAMIVRRANYDTRLGWLTGAYDPNPYEKGNPSLMVRLWWAFRQMIEVLSSRGAY